MLMISPLSSNISKHETSFSIALGFQAKRNEVVDLSALQIQHKSPRC